MDFNDYSTQSGLNWRPIALIAGGVLGLVVVIGLIIRFTGPSNRVALEQLVDQQVETIQENCANAQDPEACAAADILDSVELSGEASMCDALPSGTGRDDCFFLVAQGQEDPSMCKLVEQEPTKTLCLDTVYRLLAEEDIAQCDKLSTQEKQENCRATLNPVTLQECEAQKNPSAECQFLVIAEQAQVKQDASICDRLEAGEAEECRELVLVDDPDFDGISTDQERNKYGTDPYNPDTDGDGYSDGDEVDAGYNPNGEGELE